MEGACCWAFARRRLRHGDGADRECGWNAGASNDCSRRRLPCPWAVAHDFAEQFRAAVPPRAAPLGAMSSFGLDAFERPASTAVAQLRTAAGIALPRTPRRTALKDQQVGGPSLFNPAAAARALTPRRTPRSASKATTIVGDRPQSRSATEDAARQASLARATMTPTRGSADEPVFGLRRLEQSVVENGRRARLLTPRSLRKYARNAPSDSSLNRGLIFDQAFLADTTPQQVRRATQQTGNSLCYLQAHPQPRTRTATCRKSV